MRPQSAETWLAQLAGSAVRSVKRSTVREALDAYLADLIRHGRADTAREAEGRFKTGIYDDLIADLQLESVTRDDFLEWRDRLLEGRQARTVNRHVRAVIAALNQALDLGHLGNPAAWKLKALADDIEESGETAVFLDAVQRKAVIAAASPAAALFLRGLELTGARPKELAATVVADFRWPDAQTRAPEEEAGQATPAACSAQRRGNRVLQRAIKGQIAGCAAPY